MALLRLWMRRSSRRAIARQPCGCYLSEVEDVRIGPYRVQSELGSGGMGRVFAATVEEPVAGVAAGTTVALKLVHAHLLTKEGYRDRFLREVDVGKRIMHPNVVRTLDGGEIDGQPFVALEFVEGQTVEDLCKELGRVPEDLCRHIGCEVAKGLGAIHDAGIVHRDLKPANVLITSDQSVKVMDLGLARHATGEDRLSMTGMFIGTAAFSPPEQFRGAADLDERADLYALGAMLYDLATGEPPFSAPTFEGLMRAVLDERPRRPGKLNPQLSPLFEELVLMLLAKQPEQRPESAALVADVLEHGEAAQWWSHQATRIAESTRRPLRRIRIPRETDCVGREDELTLLNSLYEPAAAGDGRVLLIEGEAGIGKSRLVDEFVRRLGAAGQDVNFLFGSFPPGGAATVLGAFSDAYGQQFGDRGSRGYLRDVPALAPAFDALLRGEIAPDGAERLSQQALQTVFVHATRSLAAERPTIVFIDDLHFAPAEGRSVFASLAMAVTGHRLLLVGTARPGVSKEWYANVARLDHVTRMPLHRLGPDDVAGLLAPVLGISARAERLSESIASKADGNPFFLLEIVRSLRDVEVLVRDDDGGWATRSIVREIKPPSTIESLIELRLEALSPEDRELLELAACRGFEFDGRLLAAALGAPRLATLRALGRMEREQSVVRASGPRFVFDHHALQELIYDRLPEAIRQEYHGALADALAAEAGSSDVDGVTAVEICRHYLAAARGPDALEHLDAALSHLKAAYEGAAAADLARRALDAPGLVSGSLRVDLLVKYVDFLDRLGHREEQIAAAREALRVAEECDDEKRVTTASVSLGRALMTVAKYPESEARLRAAADAAERLDDDLQRSAALGSLGNLLYLVGQYEEVLELYERALAARERTGDAAGVAVITGNIGNALQKLGRIDEARRKMREGMEASRRHGERYGEASAAGNLGGLLWSQGRHDEARELVERDRAISREIGNREGEVRATGNLGIICVMQGRVEEGRKLFARHLELSREIDRRWGEAIANYNLARFVDNDAEALELARDAQSIAADIRNMQLDTCSRLLIGDRLLRLGRTDEATQALLSLHALAEEHGESGCAAQAMACLATHSPEHVGAALAAVAEHGNALDPLSRRECLLWLYRATGDRAHLEAAKQSVDESVAGLSDERRAPILENIFVNREIIAAWEALG